MGIGKIFDISVRTMATYQRALDVTSQNVSNAGNEEYTRQKVVFGTEETQAGIGMGVKIQDVVRVKNDLIDKQIYQYQSTYSDANKRSELLQQVETILAEPGDYGLSNYFNQFFNSWSQLATNPTSIQYRTQIIQNAQRLSERFKDVYDSISSLQHLLKNETVSKVDQMNSYLKEIYDLNRKIYDNEAVGIKASELMDRRDLLLNELSKLANITISNNEYGTVTVSVGGVLAADRNVYTEFTVKLDGGKLKVVPKADENSTVVLNNGELFALTELYSKQIPKYKSDLENLANVFIDKVNELHRQGYTLVQSGSSSTDIPFFGTLSGGSVVDAFVDGKININPAILNNPKNIAASGVADNDGNSDYAVNIAALADTKFSELGDQTILEAYSTILNNFGLEKVQSDNRIQTSEMVLQQLNLQKSSYSGVSIDEEMTNVIKYQRSYEAAARLIRAADEMLETIIQMV
jgi:flagellar hook-associated protein 1 FlgK